MGSRNRNLLDILNVVFILIAITYAKSVRKKGDNTGIAVKRRQTANDGRYTSVQPFLKNNLIFSFIEY